jgi:hypothetical protein
MDHWIDQQLAAVFAFDAVDVAANRSGLLSPDQEAMCIAVQRRGGWFRRKRVEPITMWRVFTVEGTPTWTETLSGHALIEVGGVAFPMDSGDARLFDTDRVYRVHYTPDAHRTPALLSVEVRGPVP